MLSDINNPLERIKSVLNYHGLEYKIKEETVEVFLSNKKIISAQDFWQINEIVINLHEDAHVNKNNMVLNFTDGITLSVKFFDLIKLKEKYYISPEFKIIKERINGDQADAWFSNQNSDVVEHRCINTSDLEAFKSEVY